MDKPTLLDRYRGDARIQQAISHLQDTPPARLHLEGLVGSAAAVMAAALYREQKGTHCFVLHDKEEAAYFLNDLQSLLERKDVLFIPDSFKQPGRFDEVNPNNVLLRTEAVNRLANSSTRGELIVTYPEALFERIVSPAALQHRTLYITKGEKLDTAFLMDVLVESGFHPVDFVYEPGQFSIRGGIIDVFSFGNELPYRIELFGDMVDSIRVFEPESQLSTKNIAQVTIVPNIQTEFDQERKQDLLKSLPEGSVVWLSDARHLIEVLGVCAEKATAMATALKSHKTQDDQHLLVRYSFEQLFTTQAEVLDDLTNLPVVETGSEARMPNAVRIEFGTRPQPSFNKNFDLLIADLKRNTNEGLDNYLYCSNPRQIERFRQIFADLQARGSGTKNAANSRTPANGSHHAASHHASSHHAASHAAEPPEYQPVSASLANGFIDSAARIAAYTDHQVFERYHKYSIKRSYTRSEALTLRAIRDLVPGDFVTHIDHGVGTYSGLEKIEVNGQVQEAVRLVYRDNDLLYVPINALHKIAKHVGKEGEPPKVNKLGTDAWENLKRRTRSKVKDIARDLIQLYAKRKAAKGFAFSPDTYLQTELEASFFYEDTPDQEKSTADIKRDMESPSPMDRLVCGDVGFGKTEIAVRAAFKAVADNKQVAVLVPTTILALQHYKTFSERLKDFPCRVDYINRFKSAKEKKETLDALAAGKVDILIGTHAIVGKSVKFKNLGLMIIDEEQKFGVAIKERLKELKANIDTLTLTATPIPRTLKFSLMGARDLSIINTPPPNRQPIHTELKPFDPDLIREAIQYEVYRGGQVFFVHNRVKDIEEVSAMIRQLCPDMDIGVAHGQLEGHVLEERMLKFINRQYDILVCTNIVESGLDIPNANTIIIHHAQNFGLSDLHQLRGRVGRSNKKAFCYLFAPPAHMLSSDARKRLKTIEEFASLGSGFQIAMRDMDIRGAGNLLGGEQSGFLAEIGFEMYHKILDEAIAELKSTDFKELFAEELERTQKYVSDCQIDTDLEMLIPDHYVNSVAERLSLYTQLDNIPNEAGLEPFRQQLLDRFGPLPRQVEELFNGVRLRWLAVSLGFDRILFKQHVLRCYFLENQESAYYSSGLFANLIRYVQSHPGKCRMKEARGRLQLTFEDVRSMKQAFGILTGMAEALGVKAATL
jgi:transcription-repair coupling factor (superfamily II helicase)